MDTIAENRRARFDYEIAETTEGRHRTERPGSEKRERRPVSDRGRAGIDPRRRSMARQLAYSTLPAEKRSRRLRRRPRAAAPLAERRDKKIHGDTERQRPCAPPSACLFETRFHKNRTGACAATEKIRQARSVKKTLRGARNEKRRIRDSAF